MTLCQRAVSPVLKAAVANAARAKVSEKLPEKSLRFQLGEP
jgi:hypothetical protein